MGTGLILSGSRHTARRTTAPTSPLRPSTRSTTRLDDHPELRDRVYLSLAPRSDLSGLPFGHFDTVVLNSVVQYFPDQDYLTDVLDRVSRLPLLAGPCTWVTCATWTHSRTCNASALDRARPSARLHEVCSTAELGTLDERELCLSPAYFREVAEHHPLIAGVDIRLKEDAENIPRELAAHRYEVVLRVTGGTPVETPTIVREPRWDEDLGTLDSLDRLLREDMAGALIVRGAPNPLLARAEALDTLVADLPEETTVAASTADLDAMVDPDHATIASLRRIAADHGRTVVLVPSSDSPFRVDLYLLPRGFPAQRFVLPPPNGPTGHKTTANRPRAVGEDEALILDLRAHLSDRLPRHMLPSFYRVLDRMPLTRHGKINRPELPRPSVHRGGGRPPGSPREQILCDLFADILRVEEVGTDDDFFQMGGHSLQATQVVSRVATVLGSRIDVRDLFRAPTPATLETLIAEASPVPPLPPLRPRAEAGDRPLSYAQQRLWFLQRMEGFGHTHNIPVALSLTGALNPTAMGTAVQDLVDRHAVLRTVFPEEHGRPTQRVLSPSSARVEMERHTVDQDTLDDALSRAAREPFDLTVEPPLRVHLYTLSPNEHVLLLLLHHIAGDGWSFRPLMNDLVTSYNARSNGSVPETPELPVEYSDYALWQREVMEAPEGPARAQMEFWRATLDGAPATVTPPTDRTRPDVPSHRGGTVQFSLPADLHAELLETARDRGATLFMVLHTALCALLTRVGAGTVSHGRHPGGHDRPDPGLAGRVFVNALPYGSTTTNNPSGGLLDRVRAPA